jgi:hypothetical protein
MVALAATVTELSVCPAVGITSKNYPMKRLP